MLCDEEIAPGVVDTPLRICCVLFLGQAQSFLETSLCFFEAFQLAIDVGNAEQVMCLAAPVVSFASDCQSVLVMLLGN